MNSSALGNQVEELILVLEKSKEMIPAIAQGGEWLANTLKNGGKVLTCGNGGSATDAAHLAEELVGRFDRNRRSLPAISLASDSALLTCIGNDYGFENLFSRQVEGLGKKGDLLVVFTTSGNSPNILRALEQARKLQIRSIALLGKDGGKAKGLADLDIIVPSSTTARIQEVHTFILHCWLSSVEGESWVQ
jgi:D-sedoheptulose 7-phosphate isomerase